MSPNDDRGFDNISSAKLNFGITVVHAVCRINAVLLEK